MLSAQIGEILQFTDEKLEAQGHLGVVKNYVAGRWSREELNSGLIPGMCFSY